MADIGLICYYSNITFNANYLLSCVNFCVNMSSTTKKENSYQLLPFFVAYNLIAEGCFGATNSKHLTRTFSTNVNAVTTAFFE